MKFLIAATILCFALVRQIQGGSLRGLTVAIPHQVYGAPVDDNEIQIEESHPIDEANEPAIIDEKPIVYPLSVEYGAPTVGNIVHFGTPSDTYGPPSATVEVVRDTPKPNVPYLKPGIPALPAAPVIPIIVKEPEYVNEVSTAYLPPVAVKEPVEEPVQVNEVLNTYLPPIEEIQRIPAPLTVEEYKPSEVYGPPTVHVPELPEAPQFPIVPTILSGETQPPQVIYGTPLVAHNPSIAGVHIVQLQPHFPAIPEVGAIPIESHKQGYHYKVPAKEFSISIPVKHNLVSHPLVVPHHAYGAPHF